MDAERMAGEENDIHKLLVQLKHGDDTAAVKLHARLFEFLTARGMKKGLSRQDAEDLVQETSIRILTKEYNEEIQGGKKWIITIYDHLVTDLHRQSYRLQARDVRLDDPNAIAYASDEEDPEQIILTEEQAEDIKRTWEALPEEDKIEIAVKGRGRGTGRKAYHASVEEARNIYHKLNEPSQCEPDQQI